MFRPGVLERGRVVGLVVTPPGRPAYVELTTWFSGGGALTSNGRTGTLPPRPRLMHLLNLPDLAPGPLLELHRKEVALREAKGRTVEVQRGLSAPLQAVARYLDALGF